MYIFAKAVDKLLYVLVLLWVSGVLYAVYNGILARAIVMDTIRDQLCTSCQLLWFNGAHDVSLRTMRCCDQHCDCEVAVVTQQVSTDTISFSIYQLLVG